MRLSWTFRIFVLLGSSRIKASVCFQGVEVMESCSQRPAETHVVDGPGQLKHTEDGELVMEAGPVSGPGALLTLNCLSVENPSSCSRTEM